MPVGTEEGREEEADLLLPAKGKGQFSKTENFAPWGTQIKHYF